MAIMARAFISYTHADEGLKDQFLLHLAPLKREGLVEVFHDRMLRPGDHLDQSIQRELASSDLVVLLVSAAFLNSEYCYEEEMRRAFIRQRDGTAKVVTVILKPCQWMHVPVGDGQTLSSFLSVPRDGKPVTSWSDPDAAFDDAAAAIRRLLVDGKQVTSPAPAASRGPEENAAKTAAPPLKGRAVGGTRLLPQRITDRDRDQFLRDALEVAAATFRERLEQLSSEDPRVDTDFERIDSRSFAARVYADGNNAGFCRIFNGAQFMSHTLCLSFDAHSTGSMNEWLSLDEAGGTIGFKAQNLSHSMRNRDEKLDHAAAAEHLWDMFLSHVKARLR
jgi:hypothetical protein